MKIKIKYIENGGEVLLEKIGNTSLSEGAINIIRRA